MSREVHFDVSDIEFQNVGVASEEGTDAEPDIGKKTIKYKKTRMRLNQCVKAQMESIFFYQTREGNNSLRIRPPHVAVHKLLHVRTRLS